jgi:enoyl-CoA hydratase
MSGTGDFTTVRYRVDGPAAWVVMNRPDAANAQSSRLISELDAALDVAEADDAVRVVVVAGEGKHFSAGHDLKEIMAGSDPWTAMRSTIEGTLRHEQAMYFDKCVRLRDFRKPTIAAVQGACAAAGLMLAAMCDLVVAAEDARFSNPVLRMSGVAVELLVEPWELGPRKAKEFLLCQLVLSAAEAERLGLVNRVVARDALWPTVQEMAETIALVPPITAEAIKDTINRMADIQGQREHWRYHFMVHQFVSTTETAAAARAGRASLDDVKAQQQGRR